MGDKVLYFAYASCMFKQRLNKSSATLKTIAKLEVGPFLRITITVYMQPSFPVIHKVGNLVLLTFENK